MLTDEAILHRPNTGSNPGTIAYDFDLARFVASEVRQEMERLFWEACQPHGKAGEVVYMTYKTKRDAARLEGASNEP